MFEAMLSLDMQGACMHDSRWVMPSLAAQRDEESGSAAGSSGDASMLVKFPADLAWSGLACQVGMAGFPLQAQGPIVLD